MKHSFFYKYIHFSLFIVLFILPLTKNFASSFYWDDPKPVTAVNSHFPVVLESSEKTFLLFEEVTDNSQIYIDIQAKGADSFDWGKPVRVAGPFAYSGEVPDLYSAAISAQGTIAVAALVSDRAVGIYVSSDGQKFTLKELPRQSNPVVGPRIYSTKTGGFLVFAASGENETFSLLSSVSSNGETWTSLTPFAPSVTVTNPFAPALLSVEDGYIVVFQGQYQYLHNGENRRSYQLYASKTSDNLKTWTPPTVVTNEKSLLYSSSGSFFNYNNQRPVLYSNGKKNYIAWERTYYTSESAHIWVSEIDNFANLSGGLYELTTQGNAHRPVFFSYDDFLNVAWFDNRRGNDNIYMAQSQGFAWEETRLVLLKDSSTFVYPVFTKKSDTSLSVQQLSFIWQQQRSKQNSLIYTLTPDRTVLPPKILANNFKEGRRSTSQKVSARVVLPEDSSGIAGFSWIWTTDPKEEPPEEFMNLPSELNISASADSDGVFYFKVRANDYAGNWSTSATLSYHRDLTPPKPPLIQNPATDEFGFMRSNEFSLAWQKDSSDDDVAGYSWTLEKVSEIDSSLAWNSYHSFESKNFDLQELVLNAENLQKRGENLSQNTKRPPNYNMGLRENISYNNLRNGIYVFSVCAIDTVGNVGLPSKQAVILNKYEPSTKITGLNTKKDEFGQLEISVYGQDFLYDGTVKEIYIDRDGKLPYDRTLSLQKDEYRVVSSTLIRGISLEELEVGEYRVYLNHSQRGIYPLNPKFTLNRFTVDESGTVKIEHPYELMPEWTVTHEKQKIRLQTIDILLWCLVALCLLGAIVSVRGLALTAEQSIIIKREVHALLTGDDMPLLKKQKTEKLRQRGVSLKFKLVGFTASLVLTIVLMVSIPLGMNMLRTQERTLATGLENRVNVLMESISSGVRSYLPNGLDNILELNYLPQQTASFEEAAYATILGMSADGGSTNLDYVWASNDNDILEKIDTVQWSYGRSRLQTDSVAIQIAEKCHNLENLASEQVGELAEQIRSLNAEGARLARATDSQSVENRNRINDEVRKLNENVTKILNEISVSSSGAEPYFDNGHLDRTRTEYIFYKPVLYRQGGDSNLVHAVVIMKVSTENLIKEVDSARRMILFLAALVALIAIVFGIAGSYFLASVIVRPIKTLVLHVNKIGETKDKKLLKDYSISVTSRDEIGTLGFAVNDMTAALVKAAEDEEKALEQEKMALDGKAVQQTFLPLVQNDKGAKQTTARLTEKNILFSGYYEGADAVSGDYFDYKKLDERYYAIIKCDVSGHGVPAALIMTVVATLFRKYFENWTIKTHGTSLDKLVVQINDFIESLGVKGKFATLMICLFDTKTGDVHMCNAGDNIIHVFDSATRKQKVITLHEAPAAGPLPSFMVEMKGGFKVEKINLKKGDVLFLYTDGIEEATRFFRNSAFEITKCTWQNLAEGKKHENHKVGQESEQMEPERVTEILESVLNKKKFRLQKYHNPVQDEILDFDFTSLQGNIDEAIMALASVEKVFRMYKAPGATGSVSQNEKGDVVLTGAVVRVDRKIDDFLKATFNRYDYYCSDRVDMDEANYVYYTGIEEDPQADDLTLLAVQKL